jgi:hypothetical protein
MDLDFNIAAMYALDVGDSDNIILLSQDVPYSETALVFGVSKSFSLGN